MPRRPVLLLIVLALFLGGCTLDPSQVELLLSITGTASPAATTAFTPSSTSVGRPGGSGATTVPSPVLPATNVATPGAAAATPQAAPAPTTGRGLRTLGTPPASTPSAAPGTATRQPTRVVLATPAAGQAATVVPSAPITSSVLSATEPLPVDPKVHKGVLANGLTYIVRANAEPPNRAELRLVVNAGSVLEDDDQQGLAHFLEHMLFNGTRSYPKGELIRFLESIGMRFGPDINAYTSFDETVYELRIPMDDPAVVDKAFDVLVEWAGYASLEPDEVEAERGVVIEEHRLRELNAGGRIRDQLLPALLSGSRYGDRLPIGKMDIVRSASPQTIRRFYETWYRPDLMAVIAVGDFDSAEIVSLIEDKFAALPASSTPIARPTPGVPDFAGTRYVVATDPENPDTALSIYFRQPARVARSASEYREALVQNIFFQMLNARYTEIVRQPDPPFTAVAAGPSSLVRTAGANVIDAQMQEKDVLRALESLLSEVERVRRHGFIAPELQRAQADVLEFYRRAYSERDTSGSVRYAEEYIRHFLTAESIPGIAVEYELARQAIPSITLEEVNREIEGLIGEDNRVVMAIMPQKEGLQPPTTDELAAVVQAVAASELEPYVEEAVAEGLMSEAPEPVAVLSEGAIADLGVSELVLANGVRILMKPTNFSEEQVFFTGVAIGGSSRVTDADVPEARLAGLLVSRSGAGDLSRTEVERILTGKSVEVEPGFDEFTHGFSGAASPRDLELAFQLMYLYVTQPGIQPDLVETLKASARASLANRDLSPEAAFQDAVAELVYGDTIRRKPVLPLAEIETLDARRALQIYRSSFRDMGQFTFVFVGNFDPARLRDLAQRYLGTLPGGPGQAEWENRLPPAPSGFRERTLYRGNEARSTVQLLFPGSFEATPLNEVKLSVLRRVLSIRLIEVLRERLGATYSPSVGVQVEQPPTSRYLLRIGFTTEPARADELVDATWAEIEALQAQGPSPADLASALEQERRLHEEALSQNGYWLGLLEEYALDPSEADLQQQAVRFDDMLKQITVPGLQETARQYLRSDDYVKAVLHPADQKPQ